MIRFPLPPGAAIALLSIGPLVACGTTPVSAPSSVPATRTVETTPASTAPVAFLDDRPVRRGDLETALAEYGGGVVLREHLLDLRLSRLAASRGIAVDEAMKAEELDRLLTNLDPDRDRAVELLAEVRARQGLGEARFDALLARNATLRALVAPEVRPDEAAIARIHDVRHGPRRRVRVIATRTLAEAETVLRDLDAGAAFDEIAYRRSTDPSRAAGGLVPPVTRLDPSWPASFRETVFGLAPGEVSTPVLVEDAWVLVACLEEQPGDGTPLAAVRPELERLARLQQERVLMDRLVREVDAGLDPRVLDPTLREAWRRTRPRPDLSSRATPAAPPRSEAAAPPAGTRRAPGRVPESPRS